jgi:hypothetical protein
MDEMRRSRPRALLLLVLVAGCHDAAPAEDLAAARDGGSESLTFPDRSADARPPDAPRDTRAGPVYFAVNHLLCTGQSLSVGSGGSPALSTTQPFANKMFNTGVLAGGTNLTSFVPLVEAAVETMSSGLANQVTKLASEVVLKALPPPENTHALLVSCHGVGGQPYSALKKGTTPYANGLAQMKAAQSISTTQKLSYVIRGVTAVHGESDQSSGNTAYAANLATWQSDYETDAKALTGQTEPVPFFHTQISCWTKYNSKTSTIPLQQLQASVTSGGKIVMVGPKYFLPYTDGVHLTNVGYRWMGEYYAKAYTRVILERAAWEPLRPTTVTRSGAVITVQFIVPSPPLVLDTTRVSDPGHNGFEYWDDSAAPPAISKVALAGADKVEITLASAPAGKTRSIRYAYTGTVGAAAGPTTGPRGNLRDSDAAVSRDGKPLFNWAVHFAETVP